MPLENAASADREVGGETLVSYLDGQGTISPLDDAVRHAQAHLPAAETSRIPRAPGAAFVAGAPERPAAMTEVSQTGSDEAAIPGPGGEKTAMFVRFV